ncbi:MAG: hypothetical protein NTZ83_06490, partial [Candidatus Pacearchaeota archaeon]|nr:hypothetical protein [Candidatus Pacearchaeota archaeon]
YAPSQVIFYDQLYKVFGDNKTIEAVILLGSLNYKLGTVEVEKIKESFFDNSFKIKELIKKMKKGLNINIESKNGFLLLKSCVSFSFYHSIPPEFLHLEKIQKYYNKLMSNLNKKIEVKIVNTTHSQTKDRGKFFPFFELDEKRRYSVQTKNIKELDYMVQYSGKEDVFGGQDRFSSRVSPTNSIVIENNILYVDKENDALDFLVPLRIKDGALQKFIDTNFIDLLKYFISKSDIWEKDQHYTWVRNCFRHFGMEAIYSGSGGMLSRADVSVINPFIGGIEIKSPRENRGTVSTKAIRQAVDAKIQVADQYDSANIPRAAIAIGRRITTQAINEEKKWNKENQPILLLNDIVLQFLVLESALIEISRSSLVDFFTSNHGLVTDRTIMELFTNNTKNKKTLQRIEEELQQIKSYITPEDNED